jgi:hypothetical protein
VCGDLERHSAGQQSAGFGAEVVDVPKPEADKLGWDAPHGAKVSRIEPGSPADKAGIALGDIVLSLDRTEIDNAADFNASLEGKRPGTEVRLRVLSKGRELRVAVVLDERQKLTVAGDAPILQLDTGGHMGLIKSLAFAPDGRYLVLVGEDKVIRVWDWQAGTIVRSIRGQTGAGDEGKVYAMALSPDGRWLAAGGYFGTGTPHQDSIRLYEFATGRLVGLLKGHTNVVTGLAFASGSKRLISGSADRTAIIWDFETRALAHHLTGHTDAIYAVGFSPDGARAITGSDDKTLKLWSVPDGAQIATLSGGNDKVRSVPCRALMELLPRAALTARYGYGMGAVDASCAPWRSRVALSVRSSSAQAASGCCPHAAMRAVTTPSVSGTWLPANSVWPIAGTITPCSPGSSVRMAGGRPRAAATTTKFTSGMLRAVSWRSAWPARVPPAGPRPSPPMGSTWPGATPGENPPTRPPTQLSGGCA